MQKLERFPLRAIVIGIILCHNSPVFAADPYTVGQDVEVREGDTWSPASILAHEGRKYQIRYKDDLTSSEWVTTDRIRLPAAAPARGGSKPVSPAAASNAVQPVKAPDYGGFHVGDQLEVKWGGLWRKAEVVRQSNGWTLIAYDVNSLEWVQPWRLRAIGATNDGLPWAGPREGAQRNSPAPTDPPDTVDRSEPGKPAKIVAAPNLLTPLPITECDVSNSRELKPTTVETAPTADNPVTAAAPRMISLHHGPPAFGTDSNIVVHPQGKFALLAFSSYSGDKPTSIQRVELASGDAATPIDLLAKYSPLAINADGTRMIGRSDRHERENMWRLDLWSLTPSTPKPLLSFRPYHSGDDNTDGVIWAAFADPTHLLTMNVDHKVSLFRITDSTIKEIYSLQSDGTVFPQLSPGGKYITVGMDAQVFMIDVLSGRCVAKSPAPPDVSGLTSSLRSDVRRLALAGERRLIILDLESSKPLLDVGLPTENLHGSSLAWLTPSLLLIDDHLIFDVDHQAAVWDYTMPRIPPLTLLQGGHLWYMTQSSGGAEGKFRSFLTSLPSPDPKVLAADQHIADGVLLVQPGSKVSLQVNVDGTADDRQKITDHFTQLLSDGGLTIADGQPVRLIVETKAGQSQTKTYTRMFGNANGNGNETVTATQTICRIAFEADGKEVWAVTSTSGGYLPNQLWLKKDQSAADAIAQQNKPQLSWFLKNDIPQTILKPTDPAGSEPFPATEAVGRMRRTPR
jgi:hypothetical protein